MTTMCCREQSCPLAGCIVSIDDGRRFEIIYDYGEELDGESEGSRPEKVDVRQMAPAKG